MRRLLDPLQAMGAPIHGTPESTAPLRLEARPANQPLRGGDFWLEVPSAQVKSAVLLAGLAADSPVSIHEPGLSRDHTERLLAGLGLPIQVFPGENRVVLPPLMKEALPAFALEVPGDFSAAAFLIVAALILPDSRLEIRDVGLNPRRTGLLDVLRDMGADIAITDRRTLTKEPVGDLLVRSSALSGVHIGGDVVASMIDEFPILAVAAALAEGPTYVQDAGELRHKETDRIRALVTQFAPLGVDIREEQDGFVINGRPTLQGGRASALGDHRMALALAVLGLAARDGVEVQGGEILDESFPNFVQLVTQSGGELAWTP
jgi:3-phosphoshikimate 1-carboxyvinyltransferase